MKMILMQLLAYFGICISTSVIASTMYYYQMINTEDFVEVFILLSISFAFFLICNILLMRKQYLKLHDRKMFRKRSYTAYGIFTITNLLLCFILNDEIYGFLFNMMSLLAYCGVGFSALASALVIHCVMLIIIPFVPSIAKATTKRIRGRRVW